MQEALFGTSALCTAWFFDRYQRPDTSGRARLPRSRRERLVLYFSLAYSALAAWRMGRSVSASFQRAKKS